MAIIPTACLSSSRRLGGKSTRRIRITPTASMRTMSVDQTKHSLFGVSKLAGDLLVQEYGRYFGMKTVCFRGGCLTGPGHSGAMLHGFLSYLMKCAITGETVHDFRLQGQAGPRQHSFVRSGQHVLALLPEPAIRRGLQRRWRTPQQLLDAERLSLRAKNSPERR